VKLANAMLVDWPGTVATMKNAITLLAQCKPALAAVLWVLNHTLHQTACVSTKPIRLNQKSTLKSALGKCSEMNAAIKALVGNSLKGTTAPHMRSR
jgi:hypothetical protein